jgi:hypothetical protein
MLSLNRKQKKLLANVVIVVAFTTAMVVGFANIKNVINRSEATRAIGILGKEILQYRQKYGSLPPETYVKQYEEAIGAVRLSDLQYRAQWIEYGADPNTTILAYSEKNYRGFVKGGYLVLWLNGKVEWISNKKQFEKILAAQQQQQELQWLQEHLQKNKDNLLQ